LLSNIFLLKGKDFHDLNHLDIFSYPEDISKIDDNDFIQKIILGHEHGSLLENFHNGKKNLKAPEIKNEKSTHFAIDCPVPQVINNQNIYTLCINGKTIIGLIFEKDDNPYDYKEIFEDLSNEFLNNERCCDFEDEIEIENFLLTLFIDIRRYGDEILEYKEIAFQPADMFTKVFLFGVDEAGKTSLVRRLKTGQFNDNYFTPTRKFNIEYIQREKEESSTITAFWDMPGQNLFREKWLTGLQDSNIFVYMIDIANQLRFEESKREFWKILQSYELSTIPLLILGNKIDLLSSSKENIEEQLQRTKEEILDFFEFDKLGARNWKFLFTSVKTNYNVDKVIKTIFSLIAQQ